jgi:hypothetical protein
MTEPCPGIIIGGEYRVFTLAEVRDAFPLVQRITRQAHADLEPVRQRLARLVPGHPAQRVVEAQYEIIVRRWLGKMERLGLLVRGLWLVDFDTGDGFLCWRFPQLKVGHYYAYGEAYTDRRPIDEVVEEFDPDWAHG